MKNSTPYKPELNNSIIYPVPDKNQYLHDYNTRIKNLSIHKGNICVALVVDTEFTGHRRRGITVQIKGIHIDRGIIYDHFDLQQYALDKNKQLRHLPVTHDFACLNYLESFGHIVELLILDSVHTTDLNRVILPYCQFDIYSHFALAELLIIFTGIAREKVIETILHGQSRVIEMTRRLRTYTLSKKGLQVSDAIELPLHMILDDQRYRIKLRIIDTCALHGVASYKNLAIATGVELKYKESLTKNDLENMIFTYFDKPIEFDQYALGDLEVYNILARNAELFRKVYKSLDKEDYFQAPKLTIGSTVRDLFKGVLYKELAIRPDELEKQKQLSKFLSYGSSSTLKKETNTTRCLLAKVFGGRCRNNRPTDIKNDHLIVDNDIAGAYGNGLRNQIYPIGKPIIEDFKRSKFNKYNTLREWLKKRKYGKKDCELVDGLWTAVVSTKQIDTDNHPW